MNAKKTYLSRYRHSLPVFFPNKRRLLKHMDQYLEDYLEAHSNASIEDILTELGTPEDAAKLYLEDNFHDYISYTKKQHMLVIIMIVVVFLFMIYGTYNYSKSLDSNYRLRNRCRRNLSARCRITHKPS